MVCSLELLQMLKVWGNKMDIITNYLNILHEQFSPSIAVTNIHGEYQNAWTECFTAKCAKETENKYAKNYCKTECKISAANEAITKINAQTSNCSGTRDPKRCIDSLRSAVDSYKDKIISAREMQDKIASRESEFRRKSSEV